MGISQAKFHKRKKTGGRFNKWRKKRKFELGRPAANTKLMAKRVRPVRCRGGNIKMRALRLDTGNFFWPSEKCARKAKILDVVYNSTNNELVRTKTIVKSCILKIDASAFKSFYQERYAVGTAQGKDFLELADITDNVYVKKVRPRKEKKPVVEEKKDTKKGKKGADKKGADKKSTDKKGAAKKGADIEKVENVEKKNVKKKKLKGGKLASWTHRNVRIPKIDPVLKEIMKQGIAYARVSSRPGQVGRADGYILEGKELDFYRKKMDKKKQK